MHEMKSYLLEDWEVMNETKRYVQLIPKCEQHPASGLTNSSRNEVAPDDSGHVSEVSSVRSSGAPIDSDFDWDTSTEELLSSCLSRWAYDVYCVWYGCCRVACVFGVRGVCRVVIEGCGKGRGFIKALCEATYYHIQIVFEGLL